MNKQYTIFSFILLLGIWGSLNAQENLQNAPVPASQGRYQLLDLDSNTPCACDVKPPRHQEVNQGVTEADIRNYRMYAYKFAIGSPVFGASKLFRALEEDPAVMKLSVREWDYLMVFATADFDKASFEAAASTVFPVFSELPPAEFFLYKNASLHQTFQQVYPQGYSVSSLPK